MRDVHFEQVGEGVIVLIEQVFVKSRSADDLASMEGEVLEEGELARGQFDRGAEGGDSAGCGVEGDVIPTDKVVRCAIAASDDRPEAGE